MARTNNCPKCGMKFDSKKIGRTQVMKHWIEMQKQGDAVHA